MSSSDTRDSLQKVTKSLKNSYISYQTNQLVNGNYSLPIGYFRKVSEYPGVVITGECDFYVSGNPEFKNVRISGGSGSSVYISSGARIYDCSFALQRGTLVAGCYSEIKKVYAKVTDGLVGLGNAVSIESATLIVEESTEIHVGDESMFSSNISMRTCDGHSIVSKVDNKRINFSKSIYIGMHCWLGRNVSVNKGASIGKDSIVGQGGLLAGSLPSSVIAAGQPAKVLKENVTWCRALVEDVMQESAFEKNYKKFLEDELTNLIAWSDKKIRSTQGISLASFILSGLYEADVFQEINLSDHLSSVWNVSNSISLEKCYETFAPIKSGLGVMKEGVLT